jgi:hypothetical protein
MFSAISSIFLVFAVVLGGSGMTAYAAQDSLPNELLYPVKLFVETARYNLTSATEVQLDLLVSYANNRVDEVVGLRLQGEAVPEAVMARLQSQLQTMLRLAAGLDEERTEEALFQIRQKLRTRDQLRTMLGQPEDLDPTLEQLQAMLEAQHRLVQSGLDEPLKFRQMFGHDREEAPGGSNEEAEPKKNQDGDCPEPGECEPSGQGYGPGEPDSQGGHGNGEAGQGQPPDDSGNPDPGNDDPGNPDPGSDDPGNPDPGNDDPGNDDPGNDDPGKDDPGNDDPGRDDPGSKEPGSGSDDKGKGGQGGKP